MSIHPSMGEIHTHWVPRDPRYAGSCASSQSIRRDGLWPARVEQGGSLRQAPWIAEFASERLAQGVDDLIRSTPPRVRIMSISGFP